MSLSINVTTEVRELLISLARCISQFGSTDSFVDWPISSTGCDCSPRVVGSNSKFNPKKLNGKCEIKKGVKQLLPKKSVKNI